MNKMKQTTLALFYCQNTPGCGELERQDLEMQYGPRLRLFPIPCGGRLESIHLLRALEDFADAAYVITCPEGACRYFEGNRRAKKRVDWAKSIITAIGLEAERLGIIVRSSDVPKRLKELVEDAFEATSKLDYLPMQRPS